VITIVLSMLFSIDSWSKDLYLTGFLDGRRSDSELARYRQRDNVIVWQLTGDLWRMNMTILLLELRIWKSLLASHHAMRKRQEAQLSLGWPTVLPHYRRSMQKLWCIHANRSSRFLVVLLTNKLASRHRAVYPNWYRLVISRGNPICSFRQFSPKT